jgi:hypothetical protein
MNLVVMAPSFRVRVGPKIPVKLGQAYYALATAHAALGSVAEIGGLYILLAGATIGAVRHARHSTHHLNRII